MSPAPRPTSVPSGILMHQAIWPQYIGRKLGGGCCVPFWGGVGFPSNTMSPGPMPSSIPSGMLIHPAVWPQRTWAKNWRGLCPFWEELGLHLTQFTEPGPRPSFMSSVILIHAAVWPQYTNVTYRQTDRQTGQDRTDRTTVRQHRANRENWPGFHKHDNGRFAVHKF